MMFGRHQWKLWGGAAKYRIQGRYFDWAWGIFLGRLPGGIANTYACKIGLFLQGWAGRRSWLLHVNDGEEIEMRRTT